MKIALLYIMIGLATIVGQTTILGLPLLRGVFYDLLVPFVIFVRLSFSTRLAAFLVLVVGFVMDLFSGGQLGLYLSVYFWIFIGVKGVSDYFNVRGSLFRSGLVAFCVMAEHVILFVASIFPGDGIPALGSRVGTVIWQCAFAALTGPAVLVGLDKLHQRVLALQHNGSKGPKHSAIL